MPKLSRENIRKLARVRRELEKGCWKCSGRDVPFHSIKCPKRTYP